ncbi:DUF4359 domain-containing protein [Collimonas sp.]|jgi:hypothetical protein|uniref:DUF4359 domain-containing protein n=1 Tax=Collimonas sp. TaxID=1963772 RepID=UPI002C10B0FA|nr:DUF4359 domain-containing protein [Collimonas sp.]HWX02787.1 DUF4359 domain-containing protein [Collimonas sp.]
MKPSATIVVLSIVGLLAFTNPKLDSYEQHIHQIITQEASKRDDLTRTLGTLFGGVASSFIASSTVRNNYVLFSTYDSDLGNQHLKFVGILGNFFQISQSQSNDHLP